jgi:hypothetical protein
VRGKRWHLATTSDLVHALQQRNTVGGQLNGGTFSGDYSGTWSRKTSYSCTAGNPNWHFRFQGIGSANFMHQSTEDGHVKTHGGTRNYCYSSGVIILINSKHPKNTITFSVNGEGAPCNNTLRYTVKSGTGKFVNASGSGNVAFKCRAHQDAYSSRWSGLFNFLKLTD